MNKTAYLLLLFSFLMMCNAQIEDSIKPCSENKMYWQYKGKPVLLLGASNNDNLFQSSDVEQQLDELVAAGGNYIRNTMSSRDSGDVWAFHKLPDGKYNLDQWNEEYWEKFSTLLRLAAERDVIVQIEVWDRFDYSREPWQQNPFSPQNNVNYTVDECGMGVEYPDHPYKDLQPFFHTIKNMPRYEPKLELVKKYQEKFVDKMLSYSLQHGNVLYCMNNETSTPLEWGQYWMSFIRDKAALQNKVVYVTDMIDGAFMPRDADELRIMAAETDVYTFLDISQINSRNLNQAHWDSLRWIMTDLKKFPTRPVNNTKVYGGPQNRDIFGSSKDGVEKFCRDIIGGCASARFHRPPAGNGLSEISKNAIQSFRKIETEINFWDITPQMELLDEREPDEAYLTAQPGKKYVLYFPAQGAVTLDLRDFNQQYQLKWINISAGEWHGEATITGGDWVDIRTPGNDGWFALVVLKK